MNDLNASRRYIDLNTVFFANNLFVSNELHQTVRDVFSLLSVLTVNVKEKTNKNPIEWHSDAFGNVCKQNDVDCEKITAFALFHFMCLF